MKIVGKFIKFLLVIFLLSALNTQAKEIKLIHITDINLNTGNAHKLLKTIKEINQYKDVDLVVFGGNNISSSNIDNLNTFLYLLKKVNKKSVVLLGSSDVNASKAIDKEYYLKRVKSARKSRLSYHSKKPNYTFSCKGYRFIVMDGSKQYFQSANGYYSGRELAWLDKQLSKYENKDVIILQHFPIIQESSGWISTPKTEEYFDVLNKHKNVKVIISGHYGNNVEIKENNIYHIITESYNKNGAYKIIQMDLKDKFIGTYLVK